MYRHLDRALTPGINCPASKPLLTLADAKGSAFKHLVTDNAAVERTTARTIAACERVKMRISIARAGLTRSQREWGEKNEGLRHEADRLKASFTTLQASFKALNSGSDARLKAGCNAAGTAKSVMNVRLSLAERVLHLAERCRQMETGSEKCSFVPVAAHQVAPVASETQQHDTGVAEKGVNSSNSSSTGVVLKLGTSTGSVRVTAPSSSTAAVPAGDDATGAVHRGMILNEGLDRSTLVVHTLLPDPSAQRPIGIRMESAATTVVDAGVGGDDDADGGDGVGLADTRINEAANEADELSLFWRRYNAALATTLALEGRRNALLVEHEALKGAVRAHLASMGLPIETLPQGAAGGGGASASSGGAAADKAAYGSKMTTLVMMEGISSPLLLVNGRSSIVANGRGAATTTARSGYSRGGGAQAAAESGSQLSQWPHSGAADRIPVRQLHQSPLDAPQLMHALTTTSTSSNRRGR